MNVSHAPLKHQFSEILHARHVLSIRILIIAFQIAKDAQVEKYLIKISDNAGAQMKSHNTMVNNVWHAKYIKPLTKHLKFVKIVLMGQSIILLFQLAKNAQVKPQFRMDSSAKDAPRELILINKIADANLVMGDR